MKLALLYILIATITMLAHLETRRSAKSLSDEAPV
jgi:hypothetical protein